MEKFVCPHCDDSDWGFKAFGSSSVLIYYNPYGSEADPEYEEPDIVYYRCANPKCQKKLDMNHVDRFLEDVYNEQKT